MSAIIGAVPAIHFAEAKEFQAMSASQAVVYTRRRQDGRWVTVVCAGKAKSVDHAVNHHLQKIIPEINDVSLFVGLSAGKERGEIEVGGGNHPKRLYGHYLEFIHEKFNSMTVATPAEVYEGKAHMLVRSWTSKGAFDGCVEYSGQNVVTRGRKWMTVHRGGYSRLFCEVIVEVMPAQQQMSEFGLRIPMAYPASTGGVFFSRRPQKIGLPASS